MTNLPRPLRTALLTVHVILSVGWLGLDAALLALAVALGVTGDPAYGVALGLLGQVLLLPLALGALGSGLALSLGTRWGLVRYRWVLAKFVITVVMVVAAILVLAPTLQELAAGATGPARFEAIVPTAVALVLLLTATALSVAKPGGRTRWGRARNGATSQFGRPVGAQRWAWNSRTVRAGTSIRVPARRTFPRRGRPSGEPVSSTGS